MRDNYFIPSIKLRNVFLLVHDAWFCLNAHVSWDGLWKLENVCACSGSIRHWLPWHQPCACNLACEFMFCRRLEWVCVHGALSFTALRADNAHSATSFPVNLISVLAFVIIITVLYSYSTVHPRIAAQSALQQRNHMHQVHRIKTGTEN